MKRARTTRTLMGMVLLVGLLVTAPASAQYWTSFADNTRYMALGDSLSAGYGAHPATQGFVYQLYQSRAIDKVNNLLLCNVGVPNAMSARRARLPSPDGAALLRRNRGNLSEGHHTYGRRQ